MVTLTRELIDISLLLEKTINADCGATVLFLGTVREHTNLKITKSLTYEAYEPMALKMIQSICDKATEKWNIGKIMVIHRLGCCKPMEITVAVITTAPHRAEAFASCSWVIDEIKKTVPIWKEELDNSNNSVWIHPINP